jgi:protein-disulfide isomerase
MSILNMLRTAFVGLALLLPAAALAAALTPEQKAAVEETIREYLLKNPELMLEVMEALERRQKQAAADRAEEGVAQFKAQIFQSRHDFVLNPAGRIPVVEFFDYQCGYCKQVFPSMQKLAAEPDVRVIFKELPILGEASLVAARAALAARRQGKYLELHGKLMSHRGRLSEDAVMAMASELGLDVKQLKADMARPEVGEAIQANLELARELGIRGTPTLFVGHTLVPGAVNEAQLQELLAAARTNCKVC